MGRVRSDFSTKFFLHKIAIRQDLLYVGSGGDYHIFKTEAPFGTYRDWAGLSGGPVIEETGKLVGLSTSVNESNGRLYVLSLLRK